VERSDHPGDPRDDPAGDAVFRALADPGRRALLDALFARDGQALIELGAALPAMSRFGVAKHLRILEDAGLVTSRRVGREKHHYLNPVPIYDISTRWISKYDTQVVAALAELRSDLEARPAVAPAEGHHADTA
jgi:DNA-binding transcriptional ArsR family regulator